MVVYQSLKYAPVAELADALDLGSSIERCAGSIPVRCTKKAVRYLVILRLFYLRNLLFMSALSVASFADISFPVLYLSK